LINLSDHKVVISALFAFIFISYSFVITIPALLDRSISIFIISAITESGDKGITNKELQNIFIEKYIEGTSTINKRLHEQIVTGNILFRNNKYFITDKGVFTYKFNQIAADLLNIDDKYTRLSIDKWQQ